MGEPSTGGLDLAMSRKANDSWPADARHVTAAESALGDGAGVWARAASSGSAIPMVAVANTPVTRAAVRRMFVLVVMKHVGAMQMFLPRPRRDPTRPRLPDFRRDPRKCRSIA
jgi:hypothetical protein